MTVASITAIPRSELRGQTVLVRIYAEDDLRLRDSLPTLGLLSESGARVVIVAGSGEIAARLAQLLGSAVSYLDEWRGEAGLRVVAQLGEGEIVMIDNLAFDPADEAGDDGLADALAHLCDIYCNDAFALAHEVRASTVGVARRARLAVAGLAFERELTMLEIILDEIDEQHRPSFSVLGGELSKDKLLLAEEIARRSDNLFVAGQLAKAFLVASGILPGSEVVAQEMVAIAERMITEASEDKRDITTPVDFTVVDKSTFERLSRGERYVLGPPLQNVRLDEIEPDQVICDIGTATRWSWAYRLGHARTIFWHGPLGISEIDPFLEGTRFLAAELTSHSWSVLHRSVVCGASLFAGLRRIGFATEAFRHFTPAGRAALHFFACRPLPAVDALGRGREVIREQVRVLIPLDGYAGDTRALHAMADMAAPDAELILLHVRPGPDEERYPDLSAALSEAEIFERRKESERIFARANSILASRGLIAADQIAAQGEPAEVILRYANRIGAGLITLASGDPYGAVDATRVIDRVACAVLVARPGDAARLIKARQTEKNKIGV
jgi:phosphoglycerate kinase